VKSLLELRAQAAPDTPYVFLEILTNPIPPELLYSVYAKTLQYVNDFGKFANKDTTMAVREYASPFEQ
jgi:hypothetical protein